MAVLVPNIRRGQVKPYASIPRIDWTHPLANNLVTYLYDCGGGCIVDLVTNVQLTYINPTTASVSMSRFGPAWKNPGASVNRFDARSIASAGNDTVATTAPFSAVTGYIKTANNNPGGQFGTLFCYSDTSSNTPFWMASSSADQVMWFFNVGLRNFAFGAAQNKFSTTAMVLTTSTSGTGYHVDDTNGFNSQTNTEATSSLTGLASSFYNEINGGDGGFVGSVFYGAVWKLRALTSADIVSIHNDPWQFLVYPEEDMLSQLVGVVVAAGNPFIPIEYFPPQRIRRTPLDTSVSLNPNLFKNPFPNNQYDWNTPFRIRRSPFDLSVPLNPNLFKNPIPFFNGDQSFSKLVPDWLPSPVPPLNINLFKNPIPFFNGDQSYSKLNPDWLPSPTQAYNLNLYTVTVTAMPFNQYDWSVPKGQKVFVLPPDPLNINIFTNPYPFFNGDQSYSKVNPDWAPAPPPPLNINIFTNPYPVLNLYWPPLGMLPRMPVWEQPFNQNLFTNPIPFLNIDYSQAHTLAHLPAPEPVYNPNLYSVVVVFLPFNQYDYPPVKALKGYPVPGVGINPNLFTNPYPIINIDYSRPSFVPRALPVPDGLNINLFTNPFPFLNADYQRSDMLPAVPPWQQPYNPNLFTVVVAATPFVQTEYPRVAKPPAGVAPEQVFNPNLFTNPLPFNQFDFPRVKDIPQAPFDLSVQTNINLFKNPIPTLNIAFTPVKQPLPGPYDLNVGFQILTAVPIPVQKASYRLLVDHYLGNIYYVAGTVITEGVEVPNGWVPTIATEPLNTVAIQAYWNAGPPTSVERSQDFYPYVAQYVSVFRSQTGPGPIPTVYWAQIPGTTNTYILTGAGASLGNKTNG